MSKNDAIRRREIRGFEADFRAGFARFIDAESGSFVAWSLAGPMNYSRTDDGSSTLLKVKGELDALTSSELRPVLDGLANGSAERAVTVDLSGLRLIDSLGVRALIALYKRVRANGGAVRFIGVANQPLVIFKVLGLDLVFGLSP